MRRILTIDMILICMSLGEPIQCLILSVNAGRNCDRTVFDYQIKQEIVRFKAR